MKVTNVTKSPWVMLPVIVTVIGVRNEHTDDDILEKALKAARETRSSLFGWNVERKPFSSTVTVTLYRD